MRLGDLDDLKKEVVGMMINKADDLEEVEFEINSALASVCEKIDNAPTVEPRIEYGTDGQPYKLSMTNGKEYERPQGDLISRAALKEAFEDLFYNDVDDQERTERLIDNAPTVTEMEKPFITECRDTAIKENLPLYFVYYEETGIFEVYVTETKELFEKRHCSKHLPAYVFKEIVTEYLDNYLEWKGGKK